MQVTKYKKTEVASIVGVPTAVDLEVMW